MYKLFILLMVLTVGLNAQEKDSTNAPIKQINDSQYRLDNIFIDAAKREVSFPAMVNMERGLVEVFVCARGGKVHESVFVADVVPYYLQVALILIGLKDGHDEIYRTKQEAIKGDPVELWVDWQIDDETKRYRAEDLIWNITANATMPYTSWIFRGSWTEQGRFMADDVKSLVTTYNDPATIIDNPLATGQNDELYHANHQVLPPKGTPVTITIRAKE
jgi:hypothetical protein